MFVFSKTANTEYSHPIIGNLLSTKENNICFDCEKNNPSFISLNNSIFLCSSCAQEHKKLGNSISKILSIFIDKISNNEIKFIEKGGNRRLNELLNLYSLDKKKINRIILYCSNLLEFHRNAIKSEVYNIKCPIMISQDQILKPNENISEELLNEINEINKKNSESLLDKANHYYIQIKTNYETCALNIMKKVKEKGNESLCKVKDNAYNWAFTFKNSANFYYEKIKNLHSQKEN
jgi:ADP-ribosylation factor GTPase-activating protein 1